MIDGKTVIVVMPPYNAGQTLKRTYEEIPLDVVDEILLVDDKSSDDTINLARELNVKVFVHDKNYGYGRNQKTCYREALKRGADIVVMIHPDYQYAPRLARALASMISSGLYDVALGSRILGGGALKGGMPLYKYVANRILTARKTCSSAANYRNFIPAIGPSPRKCSNHCPFMKMRTDLFLTTKCWRRPFTFGIGSPRFPARRNISKKPRRSISDRAVSTAWAYSSAASNTGCRKCICGAFESST